VLSYQHAYHAGNFADVHKHLTLHAVTDHLVRKDSAVTYFDTHAGRGLYPLSARETHRLQEYRHGVEPLWKARVSLADEPLLHDWLGALGEVQPGGGLERYPGSPWWLARRLRPEDRLLLFELHPGEHDHLSRQALPDNARRLHGDGLAGLLSRLPVATPRLCVLIDPSYERKAEYGEVLDGLLAALGKVRHAVVLLWYPLLPAGYHHDVLDGLKAARVKKVWRSELGRVASGQGRGMAGSGMLVINPPWGLEVRMANAMARVTPLLGEGMRYQGGWWLGE
jgi:23S rRNA (adenine2030-N6)-methyltransferase